MSTAKQIEFVASGGSSSQCQLIKDYLESRPYEWVSLVTLHQVSGALAVATRISNLNAPYIKAGKTAPFENSTDNSKTPKKSFYRYAPTSE